MSYKTSITILAIVVVSIGYWWYMLVWHSLLTTENLLRVHFLDVGQGDAILIETPNKYQVLIDAGRGIPVLNALDDILPTSDRNIDIAVMTHRDADHIGGLVPVFRRYTIDTVIQPPPTSETNISKQVATEVEKEGAAVYTIDKPSSFSLDGVQFEILWPIGTEITETNAASIVLLITYGNTKILLTGDAPAAVEEFLTQTFPKKLNDIDILKAGHHGSKTSTSQRFLMHTKPNAIIYSAAEENSYGHPHAAVLGRIKTYTNKHPDQRLTEHHTANGTVSFCITPTNITTCD